MQEGHPIAFEIRKLNDAERWYSAHERKMTVVVHCLRTWRHYVLGAHFVVKTDNVATTYFQSQKKLTAKQARWQDFLAEFNFTLEYKPGKANLRRTLIKEGHDTARAGHPGQKRTLALIEAYYCWPRMRDDIEAYVRTCLICQQDKVKMKAPGGLLEPLPIAEKSWDSVTMDFITCLQNSEGFGTIMVVVDHFSKYATFTATTAS